MGVPIDDNIKIMGESKFILDEPSGGFDPDSLSTSTNTPADADLIITKESSTWYVKAFSKVWDYIKSKIGINNSQGSANKFLNEQGTFTVVNSGKEYDLEFNQTLDELILTEDNVDKTELHLAPVYVGTKAAFDLKSVTEKKQYKFAIFDTPSNNFSHIGQIIESTTLDTEAKVKAVYGASTSWIQHTGYMLRGASSGVVSGSQGQNNDGGADSQTVSSVANHNHTQNAHDHVADYLGSASGGQLGWYGNGGTFNTSVKTGSTTATNIANGANYSVATLPKYKNVYIWERIA